MWHDPIVEEIRRIREEYAGRFGYDLQAIHRDLKQREQASGRKVVALTPRPVKPTDQVVPS